MVTCCCVVFCRSIWNTTKACRQSMHSKKPTKAMLQQAKL